MDGRLNAVLRTRLSPVGPGVALWSADLDVPLCSGQHKPRLCVVLRVDRLPPSVLPGFVVELLCLLLPLVHGSDVMDLLGGFKRELDVMIHLIWPETLQLHLGPCL